MSRRRSNPTEDALSYFERRAEFHGIDMSGVTEAVMQQMADRINERAKRQFWDACDAAYRPPERGTVEVITDPTDQRGYAARKVGP